MKILIVGGDSRLSKYIEDDLIKKKYNYCKTSRRNTKNSIFLDFEKIENFIIPKNITHAIIVGGVTSYDDCDNKYEYAYNINCIKIPKLVNMLLTNNIFTIFISTNTVFKYDTLPNEDDNPSPAFSYAKLKYISEKKITLISEQQKKINKLSIIRLTKNVCENTSPFNDWIKHINNNHTFNAFNDLYFAPITFNNSSKAVLKIIDTNLSGIFHLSGEKDVSYSEFGKGFLEYLNINNQLCIRINSKELGVQLRYNHNVTALSMKYTSKKLNLHPIKLEEIYKYLSKFIK